LCCAGEDGGGIHLVTSLTICRTFTQLKLKGKKVSGNCAVNLERLTLADYPALYILLFPFQTPPDSIFDVILADNGKLRIPKSRRFSTGHVLYKRLDGQSLLVALTVTTTYDKQIVSGCDYGWNVGLIILDSSSCPSAPTLLYQQQRPLAAVLHYHSFP
jgi:hypothetical protein